MSTATKKQHRPLFPFLIIAVVVIALVIIAQKNESWQPAFEEDYAASDAGMAQSRMLYKGETAEAPMMDMEGEYDSIAPSPTSPEEERMVIRSASLEVVSDDVRSTVQKLTEHAQQVGGFVVSAEQYEVGDEPYAQVRFRVPQEGFEESLAFIRSVSLRVTSETVSGEDVTEEYVDNAARLNVLKASEQQFLEIMRRAVKIEDVLAVQRELERVRAEIEHVQGRQQYLERSTALSSFSVGITTDPQGVPVIEESNPWQPVAVVKSAVRAFIATLQVLGNAAIWIVIFLPVWGTAWLIWRRWKRWKK